MAKRLTALFLALLLCAAGARAETALERNEGEAYFPDEKNWTYHFTYAYPHLTGEDYASLLIDETYAMALDEMLQLVLPMFAEEPAMRYDGRNEVRHDFIVTCNNDRFLSILQQKAQSRGEAGTLLTLEAQVFDLAGEYLGEPLTLRGLTLRDGEYLGESSEQLAAAVLPGLYAAFQRLQAEGVARPEITRAEFEQEFSPAQCFFADEENRVVFFFPPALLAAPSFDVPLFPFTLDALAAALEGA